MTSDDLVKTSVEEDHVHRARAVYAKDQGLLDVGGPAGAALQLPGVQGTSFDLGAVVRGNVIHDAGGVGIYPDVGADWVTVQHNVVFNQYNALSGVKPQRSMVTGNDWDDAMPFWWPKNTPTGGVTHDGNRLLPRAEPLAGCRADAGCADILGNVGPRRNGRGGEPHMQEAKTPSR